MVTVERRSVVLWLGWCAAVLTGFVLACLLGITTSSMGVLTESGTADVENTLTGQPRVVRSDEYVRNTPSRLGIMHERIEGTTWTPLDAGNKGIGTSWRFSMNDAQPLFVEDAAFAAVGGQTGFVASWWAPVAMALIAIPGFLLLLGVPAPLGISASLVLAFSPANAWWTYAPLQITGVVCAAGALSLLGARALMRLRGPDRTGALWVTVVGGGAALAGAAYLWARVPLIYPPWSLPAAVAVGLVVVGVVTTASGVSARRRLMTLTALAATAALAVTAFWLLARADLSVLAQTVYPGSRRSVAAAESIGRVWGGPLMWRLQTPAGDAAVGTNQSELATGWLLLLIPTAWLVVSQRRRWRDPLWIGSAAPAAVSALLLLWSAAPWPASMGRLNPLAFIPPARAVVAAEIVVVLAFACALCLLATTTAPRASGTALILLPAGTFVAVAVAGGQLQAGALPGIRPIDVWLTAAAAAVVLAVTLAFPRRWWTLLPLVAALFASTFLVNPLVRGPGQLWDSAAARTIRSIDASGEGRWAADHFPVDTLLLANSVPLLSGQQPVGPDRGTWSVLDPTGQYRNEWNRGASFVSFEWTTGEQRIWLPSQDFIRVSIDPCSPAMSTLDVQFIASSAELPNRCLRERGRFMWMGLTRVVYERLPVG